MNTGFVLQDLRESQRNQQSALAKLRSLKEDKIGELKRRKEEELEKKRKEEEEQRWAMNARTLPCYNFHLG